MVGNLNAMISRYHCIIDSKTNSAYFQKSNPFVFFVIFSIKINKKNRNSIFKKNVSKFTNLKIKAKRYKISFCIEEAYTYAIYITKNCLGHSVLHILSLLLENDIEKVVYVEITCSCILGYVVFSKLIC